MCSENKFSAGSVVVSFLLGGAVGAGLAVLLTPKSGPETREVIKQQADTVKSEAVRIADELKAKAEELVEKSKDLVEQKKAILESALDAGKEAMEREKERLLSKVRKDAEADEA